MIIVNGKKYAHIIDLTGQIFNYLTVTKFAYTKNGVTWWEVKCRCGTIKVVRAQNLHQGHVTSCGCWRYDRTEVGGYGFNTLYGKYKISAKKRRVSFKLSKKQFKDLTQQECFYCGELPSNKAVNFAGSGKQYTPKGENHGQYIYNGIDRIDNNRGYTIDNCLPCCKTCNYAKRQLHINEFVEWVYRVNKNLVEKGMGYSETVEKFVVEEVLN